MTWKSSSPKLLDDGDVFLLIHLEKVPIYPARWDLQDRDAVSDDEKRCRGFG